MSQPFTLDDLGVLQEALSAWEQKDAVGELFGNMLLGLASGGDEARYEDLRRPGAAKEAERERERSRRLERSILLKAKLIGMKDALRADGLIADLAAVAGE